MHSTTGTLWQTPIFKGEPQLAAVVERAFRELGSNRDLVPFDNKWFVARLPTGEKLDVAISPQLEESF